MNAKELEKNVGVQGEFLGGRDTSPFLPQGVFQVEAVIDDGEAFAGGFLGVDLVDVIGVAKKEAHAGNGVELFAELVVRLDCKIG